MNRLILDPATVSRLLDVEGTVEICDQSGRLIGHFYPAQEAKLSGSRSPNSREELERLRQQCSGRPLAEI